MSEEIRTNQIDMPKHWNKAKAREALAKYYICGDHLVTISECGCKL